MGREAVRICFPPLTHPPQIHHIADRPHPEPPNDTSISRPKSWRDEMQEDGAKTCVLGFYPSSHRLTPVSFARSWTTAPLELARS